MRQNQHLPHAVAQGHAQRLEPLGHCRPIAGAPPAPRGANPAAGRARCDAAAPAFPRPGLGSAVEPRPARGHAAESGSQAARCGAAAEEPARRRRESGRGAERRRRLLRETPAPASANLPSLGHAGLALLLQGNPSCHRPFAEPHNASPTPPDLWSEERPRAGRCARAEQGLQRSAAAFRTPLPGCLRALTDAPLRWPWLGGSEPGPLVSSLPPGTAWGQAGGRGGGAGSRAAPAAAWARSSARPWDLAAALAARCGRRNLPSRGCGHFPADVQAAACKPCEQGGDRPLAEPGRACGRAFAPPLAHLERERSRRRGSRGRRREHGPFLSPQLGRRCERGGAASPQLLLEAQDGFEEEEGN